MFEEGERLRREFGADQVFDFSIGNPEGEPPAAVKQALRECVEHPVPGMHRYMPNAGYGDVREAVAQSVGRRIGREFPANNVVMTCGAAGALNIVLKSILDPGDEVIVFSPYFVEYLFYIENCGGKVVISTTNPSDFEPDLEALEQAVNSKTRAVILNSPNNPSGAVYSRETLEKMAVVLAAAEQKYGRSIFVLSDEPYRAILFEGPPYPAVLNIFPNSVVADSFSKSHAMPGERIGYVAVNTGIPQVDDLLRAMIFCNRTLGYINAPALAQRIIKHALDTHVDIEPYRRRRDLFYEVLTRLGFYCVKPRGTFYLFPRCPMDDVQFCQMAARDYRILVVPGVGFGCPGHFRISCCVEDRMIEASIPGWEKLAERVRGKNSEFRIPNSES